MTITINATPKASNANSYVTLEEANTYMEAHLQASVWASFDDEKKKAAIVSATREIDQEQWASRRETKDQNLAWPRLAIYDYDGYFVEGIPKQLKAATIELAIWNFTEDDRLAGKFEIDNMDSVEIGPIKYKIGPNAESFPDHVEDLIESIGPGVVIESGGNGIMVL